MEQKGIELLPEAPPNGKSKIVSSWGKTIGIPIFVVLQVLSFAIFGFRAKLEIDLNRLSSSIEKKEAIIAQSAEFEEVFKDTQKRLSLIAQSKLTLCYSCATEKLEEITPSEVTLIQIQIVGDEVGVSAKTKKGTAFATFLAKILQEDTVSEALLTSGNLNEEGEFIFALNLVFDKGKLRE